MNLKLSDFEIVKQLGSGSFGTVKLIRKKEDSQLFAMKTISLNKLSTKEKDSALNEVRLLASINIPNVITFKASLYDQQSNALCIIMQYADGGDLQGKVQQMREQERTYGFEQKFVWKIAYEILQGLKMLHSHKIVHRDIKSANIFFVDEIAKLGDLNVSKVLDHGLCQTQTGTPYYTSPEIWMGKKYGNRCDVWSLGVLLYEICSLKMPFTGRDIPSLYKNVIQGTYKDIPSIYSQQLKDLIGLCLIVEEQMRPSASQLLQTCILKGMQSSLRQFNKEQGSINLMDPIKCPKVLRFLAVKLPKARFQEERKVVFNNGQKKQENMYKIKSIKKIRSQKNIHFQQQFAQKSNSKKQILAPSQKNSPLGSLIQQKEKSQKCIKSRNKIEKICSKKNIQFAQEKSEILLDRTKGSKKCIKLPPLQSQSKIFNHPVPSITKQQQKRSLKHIPSSRKLIISSKCIPSNQKQN